MKTVALVVFALLLGVASVEAASRAKKPCPPKCEHRTCQATQPVVTQSQPNPPPVAQSRSGVWDAIVTGFELNAGFRWQTEQACPDPVRALASPPEVTVKDPFYLGAGVRLPLAAKVGAFGNFDRDWTDAPHWQARVGVYVNPWGR